MNDTCLTDLMRKNIQILQQFNPADFNRQLQKQSGYRDTDAFDTELYEHLGLKYDLLVDKRHLITYVGQHEIKFSADAWVGVKQLARISHNTTEWLDLYKNIQSNLKLRLLWPSHRLPTINTSRYGYFHDRVDLLLLDIKRWFDGQPALLEKIYSNGETNLWLASFNSYWDFVKSMRLDWLLNNKQVIDIVNLTTFDEFSDLNELRRNQNDKLMRRYIFNSIKLATE